MLMLIVYALIAVLMSFLCSVLEAVLLSIPPSYVAKRRVDGTSVGQRLAAYKKDVDEPLAAILTLNTFAHTIGAAGVGAEAAEIWGSSALGIVSAVMTVVILIASEIIPKTIGAVYWRPLTSISIRILQVLIILLWPIVKLCSLITGLLRPQGHEPIFKRGDFRDLAGAGHQSGVLRRDERIIISNLLRFDKLSVKDIMTSRDDIIAIPAEKTVEAAHPEKPTWWNTRMPIFDESLDDCDSYVLKEDLLAALIAGNNDQRVSTLRRPLLDVSAEETLHGCYEFLAEKSTQIAMVRDSEQNVVGIVTMEDLIETMLGMEIDDEGEPALKEEQSEAEEENILRRSHADLKVVEDDSPKDSEN